MLTTVLPVVVVGAPVAADRALFFLNFLPRQQQRIAMRRPRIQRAIKPTNRIFSQDHEPKMNQMHFRVSLVCSLLLIENERGEGGRDNLAVSLLQLDCRWD